MTEESRLERWMPWRWSSTTGWLLVLAFVMLLPFGVRAWCLSRVPDPGEPFDLTTFLPAQIATSENAFTHYNAAAQQLRAAQNVWGRQNSVRVGNVSGPLVGLPMAARFKVLTDGLLALTEDEAKWIASLRPALDEWRRGTELTLASPFITVNSKVSLLYGVHANAAEFVALARVEAMRCEAKADVAGAWEWHRAAIRFCRHQALYSRSSNPGVPTLQPFRVAATGIVRWAEQPRVTSEELRTALAVVRDESAQYQPLSMHLKTRYLLWRRDWVVSDWGRDRLGLRAKLPQGAKSFAFVGRPLSWLVGEPEVTRRLHALVLLNQLNEIDKPLNQRRPLVDTRFTLFDTDPSTLGKPGQISPREIHRALNSSALWRNSVTWLFVVQYTDAAVLEEQAQQSALEIVLAAQAFRRDTGAFPESLDQLVPEYLQAVPLDPCDLNGGRLHYRRDDPNRVIVWSIGMDGNDDGGAVAIQNGVSADVGFVLKLSDPK